MPLKNVTVLGLGTMGIGMAKQLQSAGFQVVGYNRSPSRLKAANELGLQCLSDPISAVKTAEAVIICVSNDPATESILFEQDVLASIPTQALLIDSGTTGLRLTEDIYATCVERGIDFLDAPVTGSKLGAESGNLTFMVGGPDHMVERAQPLFDAMGKHTVHAGPRAGDGQRIKYCLNMTQAIVLQGVLEGYALAQAQGLSMDVLAEVFENSAGKTGVGGFKTPFLKSGDFTPHFRLELMQKDLHLALSEAAEHRTPLPLGRTVATLYDLAAQNGWGAEDFLATAKLLPHLPPKK